MGAAAAAARENKGEHKRHRNNNVYSRAVYSAKRALELKGLRGNLRRLYRRRVLYQSDHIHHICTFGEILYVNLPIPSFENLSSIVFFENVAQSLTILQTA